MSVKQQRKMLGERIREFRNALNWSQAELAEKAGLHHNFIGEIERGEKSATVDSLAKVAKALGVYVRDLVSDF